MTRMTLPFALVLAAVAIAGGGPARAQETACGDEDSRFVAPEDLQVDVAHVPGSSSDANGVFEPGETVVVAPAWRNLTRCPVALEGRAESFTGPPAAVYSIPDPEASYGTIPPEAARSCLATGDCYGLALTPPGAERPLHWDGKLVEKVRSRQRRALHTWTLHIGDSFSDVPRSSLYYRFVETLLHHQVTAGCGAGRYCPEAPFTREQMPVFLLVAKDGAGHPPQDCVAGQELFADVPATSPFCRWIEEAVRRRIVTGCMPSGPRLYCPDAAVPREELARFVLVALEGAGYAPPPCLPGPRRFRDVPAESRFCPWIEELARRRVVGGCAPDLYCPTAAADRAQASVFVAATFGLTLYAP